MPTLHDRKLLANVSCSESCLFCAEEKGAVCSKLNSIYTYYFFQLSLAVIYRKGIFVSYEDVVLARLFSFRMGIHPMLMARQSGHRRFAEIGFLGRMHFANRAVVLVALRLLWALLPLPAILAPRFVGQAAGRRPRWLIRGAGLN